MKIDPAKLSEVMAAMKVIRGGPDEYIADVVAHLDSMEYRRAERPIRPFTLSAWSSSMLRDAMKSGDGADKYAVAEYRQWIRAVKMAERDNEMNLALLMRAVRLSIKTKKADYKRLLCAFLREQWGIGDEAMAAYFATGDHLDWIRAHANTWPGPGDDWRDPGGIDKR